MRFFATRLFSILFFGAALFSASTEAQTPGGTEIGLPPAAEIVLPKTPVVPGGVIAVELIPAGDVADVSVTLTEQGRPEIPAAALTRVTTALGPIRQVDRPRVLLDLPALLLRPSARQLPKRGQRTVEPEPNIVVIEVEGTLPDGTPAYSTKVVAFVPVGPDGSTFTAIPLSEYLEERGGESGSLDVLPVEEIVPDKGEPASAEPVERSGRHMDASGAFRPSDSGAPFVGGNLSATSAAATTVTVSGYVYYVDYNGVNRPLPYAEVAVWEEDPNSAYAAAANILLTSSTGYYSTTVSHDDGDGALELFLRVRSVNNRVRVGNGYLSGRSKCDGGNSYCGLALSSNQYQWTGPTTTGVTGGTLQMSYTIADSYKGGAQIYKWLNEISDFVHTAFAPGQVRAVWGIDFPGQSAGGAFSYPDYYHHLAFDTIHGTNRSEDVAYHEYGHFTMYRRNPYRNPNVGGPHIYDSLIHPAFAWSEGWPTGLAQHRNPDGFYDAANFSFRVKIEDGSGYTANTSTEHNELLVAAAVNDFYDYADDGDDDADRIYSLAEELEIIRTTNIDDIYEFYNKLVNSGYLTQVEKNRASRVMNYNKFSVPVISEAAPPMVAISGPSELQPGQYGTWTANASGGTGGPYTYEWYVDGVLVSTSQSFSHSAYSDFGLVVDVFDGASTASAVLLVRVSDGSCSPGTICEAQYVSDDVPEALALHAPAPNPTTGASIIRYDLPDAAAVRISVYDITGREVAQVQHTARPAGYHRATFNASALPAGVYIVRMDAGAQVATQRLVVIR